MLVFVCCFFFSLFAQFLFLPFLFLSCPCILVYGCRSGSRREDVDRAGDHLHFGFGLGGVGEGVPDFGGGGVDGDGILYDQRVAHDVDVLAILAQTVLFGLHITDSFYLFALRSAGPRAGPV